MIPCRDSRHPYSADPSVYLAEIADRDPSLLESHWIPADRTLWRIDNYVEFLAARRVMLAEAGNAFLEGLYHGQIPESTVEVLRDEHVAQLPSYVPGNIDSSEELAVLVDLNAWLIAEGLSEGELEYELVDKDSGEPLAVLDVAWPEGIQQGLTQPTAVLLDETMATEEAANAAGFRFFTSPNDFKQYVVRHITGESEEPIEGHVAAEGLTDSEG